MGSEEIMGYFKDKQNSYSATFRKVQKQIPRFTTLSEGRYDAVAFDALCIKMDKFAKLKDEGVTFEEVLDGILPKDIKETYYNGSPSDSRVQPFHYLSNIIAVKHIYQDVPGVVEACGEKFTQTVRQMIADGATYVDGAGGGPLRDCKYPERTGEELSDMQEGFNAEIGETLRQEGLGPVVEVAQETIACTDLLKPYFKDMRTEESKIEAEISSCRQRMNELEDQAVIVRQQGGAAVVGQLAAFNPFTDNLAQ